MHVDRPGSIVALALQSYDSTKINVSVSDGTQLGAVYLSGPGTGDSNVLSMSR